MIPAERYSVRIDLRGLRCPIPVLKARKRLLAMRPGERLLVEADDPLASLDFPRFCAESGHSLLDRESEGDSLIFLIERA